MLSVHDTPHPNLPKSCASGFFEHIFFLCVLLRVLFSFWVKKRVNKLFPLLPLSLSPAVVTKAQIRKCQILKCL